MTEVIDEGLIEYCREEIADAARRRPIHLYTPSILQAAAEALHGIQTVIEEHAIADAFTRSCGPLPSQLLFALTERFARENYFVGETTVDPVALLTTALEFVCDHLDEPVAALEGPAMAESRAIAAYMVLPRLPVTPAWGEDGDASLASRLDARPGSPRTSSRPPVQGPRGATTIPVPGAGTCPTKSPATGSPEAEH